MKIAKILTPLFVFLAFFAPLYSFAGQNEGGDIKNFDLQPRSFSSATSRNMDVTLSIAIYFPEFISYCGVGTNHFAFHVLKKISTTGVPDQLVIGPEAIQVDMDPARSFWTFERTYSPVLHLTDLTPPVQATSYKFYATLNCGTGGITPLTRGKQIAQSQDIEITQSAIDVSTNTGGGTTPNCGPIQCSAGGQCNNGFTGPCQTAAQCGTAPAICVPGVEQTFPFTVPNWLIGSDENATIIDVIKVIINWIRNIAIPIAVGMIIWGGIMYLTAGPFPKNVDKAKNIIKYAVLGLAIIFIGSGFITLIQSILTLGANNSGIDNSQDGTGPSQGDQPPLGAVKYGCNDQGFCVQSSLGSFTSPFCNGQCNPGGPDRTIGSLCQNQGGCLSGLVCNQGFCQKQGGNVAGEPCNIDTNCISGLFCDKLGTHLRVMDGRSLGTCVELESAGAQLGDACQRNDQCPAGLRCNQICQRSGGNLVGEACLSPNNCQSNSCRTVVGDTLGKCVSQ